MLVITARFCTLSHFGNRICMCVCTRHWCVHDSQSLRVRFVTPGDPANRCSGGWDWWTGATPSQHSRPALASTAWRGINTKMPKSIYAMILVDTKANSDKYRCTELLIGRVSWRLSVVRAGYEIEMLSDFADCVFTCVMPLLISANFTVSFT